jgi:hypothetical protein
MGFFDAVKDKAGALAADAGRAGKVTAAQARLAVLQNDLRKAERELGHEAFALIERGELDHPGLAGTAARVRTTTAEVDAKEAEIASLRGAGPEEAAGRAAETVEAVPAPGPAFGAGPEVAVADESSAPVVAAVAEQPAVEEPAQETPLQPSAGKKAAARKTSAKKPAETNAGPGKTAAEKTSAKKPAARKTSAKKPAATSPATQATPRRGTAKGGTAGTAGATPKKAGRPSSSGSRPAGKKKPAGA